MLLVYAEICYVAYFRRFEVFVGILRLVYVPPLDVANFEVAKGYFGLVFASHYM